MFNVDKINVPETDISLFSSPFWIWIDASKELPKEDGEYLCYYEYQGLHIHKKSQQVFLFSYGKFHSVSKILAWRKLPPNPVFL